MRQAVAVLVLLSLSLHLCAGPRRAVKMPADYVNPFVGTDYTGHTFPGATAPFGMVQLSPDTRLTTWEGCSGYHYSDDTILGFSHTHLSGTGVLDYGDVLFMPVCEYGCDSLDRDYYKSRFSHSEESASPGYYSVMLGRWGIFAELTAGLRTGMHRYSFDDASGKGRMLVIDLQHRDQLLDSDIKVSGSRTVSGFRRSRSWSEDQVVYFYAEFSEDIQYFRLFGKEGALLEFSPESDRVIAKVGISSVSVENARANLLSEVRDGDFDFDEMRLSTLGLWNEYLSRIDVTGGNAEPERLNVFYTAMYHAAIAPNLFSDVNGEYRGMDRQVHKAEGFDRYTVFSLWDTFRTLHPMLALIDRERTGEFLKSFLSIYREGGKLPMWELAGYETNCMIGFNSVPVIADAVIKGIGTEDAEELLEAMVETSMKDELGIPQYRERNLVPAEEEHESVSKTLEYAYDDWCIHVVASWLYDRTGEERFALIRDRYLEASANYINVLDPSTSLMRPVMNGRWAEPFDPHEVNNHYTEANSWQYSFFVPHDVNGHIRLLGGDEAFSSKLDSLFTADPNTTGRTQVDITGLIGQYAHGNEPSHQTAYLYAYTGKPWNTYRLVRNILDSLYTSRPDGLCGNDDCGQMSAWYVMSAIGLYPVTPGSNVYVFSSPVFGDISVNLENGSKLRIRSECVGGDMESCRYISSVRLNGRPYSKSYITYDDIKDGGTILFRLVPEPDTLFGSAPGDRPSAYGYDGIVRNPWFVTDSDIFGDSLEVAMACGDNGNAIYYRTGDGGDFVRYSGPFVIDTTTAISIYAESPEGKRSPVITSSFHKLKDDMDITMYCEYNPQYNARGDKGLIDGLRGSVNWKTGGWQGYQATNFTAVVDLRNVRRISLIGSGYCQDIRSWIWMPEYVEYYVSDDGKDFVLAGRVDNTVGIDDYDIQTRDFELDLSSSPVEARYIKVVAKNFGTIPEWHLGAGGEAFIFIDEIWVE